MIEPTVGRIVWFEDGVRKTQAAIITYVWSNTMVNLTVFDPNGIPFSKTSVTLVPNNEPSAAFSYPYCQWMPYQKGQAAKAEALETKMSEVQARVG